VSRFRDRRSLLAGIAVVVLIAYPLVLPLVFRENSARFWTLSIGAQSLILGITALSLVFMAGYGGMISLAQAALAGFAAYIVALAYLEPSATAIGSNIGLGLPAIPSALIALVFATLAGALFGAISSRSYGIYFLMLTLALAVGFFYLVLQNYDIFGGHIGFAGIEGPTGPPRSNPAVFYYLCLVIAALAYFGLRYLVRTPLGLTFQGIRDNPRRMRALGYRVELHRIAIFAVGGFVAGLAGVLGVWYRGNISPGVVDLTRTIDVLIVAVLGGLAYPIGAFVGAVVFLLIDTFASSIVILDFSFRERFNSLIGLGFVLIVLFAPNGIVALGDQLWRGGRRRFGRMRPEPNPMLATPVDTAIAGASSLPGGDAPPDTTSEGGEAKRDA
jgi:branched-chain amino acid transport system permease protein